MKYEIWNMTLGIWNRSSKIWNMKYETWNLKPEIYKPEESWSRPLGLKTMDMKGFRVFLKWNLKVIRPKWSRIIIRRFWAIPLIIFTVEMAPHAPLTPNPQFSWFSLIFYKISFLVYNPKVRKPRGAENPFRTWL